MESFNVAVVVYFEITFYYPYTENYRAAYDVHVMLNIWIKLSTVFTCTDFNH